MKWLVGLLTLLDLGLGRGSDKTFTLLETYPHSPNDYTYA